MNCIKTSIWIVLIFGCSAIAETSEIFSDGYNQYQQSFSSLEKQLESWTKSPVSHKEHLSPLEQDAYTIFEDVWTPADFTRFVPDSTNNHQIVTPPFILVQNSLKVEFEEDDGSYSTQLISNFVPAVSVEGAKVIVLTEERKEIILDFLGHTAQAPIANLYDSSRNSSEVVKKYLYISEILTVTPGHWAEWHLVAFPEILGIRFNQERTNASVYLRFKHGGATAYYTKSGEGWTFNRSEDTWVE